MKQVVEDLFDQKLVEDMIANGDDGVRARLEGLMDLRRRSLSDENEISSFFVPAEIAHLADPSLKGSEEWDVGKDALFWLLNEISFDPEETPLPSWLFDDEEIASGALKLNGNLICLMGERRHDPEAAKLALRSAWPAYKYLDEEMLGNRETLKAAFSCEGYESLLSEEAFRDHNDDDELVELALAASGENLSWASDRIRDDFDMVCLAIDNTDYIDNIYEDISDRLRSDRRIVIKIAGKQSVPMEFPPHEYKDDDEVGALLADTEVHGDRFSLYGMSRRIKEKYMTEYELERWGGGDEEEAEA